MIGYFSARRSYFRRCRKGIRKAFALADQIDALRLLFCVCPVGLPALRSLARLEEELGGLAARHGGRVALRIRRERGIAIPGPGVAALRLPSHFRGGELPARWWSLRAWLGLPGDLEAAGGSRNDRPEDLRVREFPL